jgi:hypothetical protein
MVFDRTCTRSSLGPGLSHAWAAGGHLYRALGRLDAWSGAASWDEALAFLATARAPAPVAAVQIWAHGQWGGARMHDDLLDAAAFHPRHRLHAPLLALRARLAGPDALVWFRTCETFATQAGHRFARGLAELLGCRVAGHTHVIGIVQSGLHVVAPGEEPAWSPEEGLIRGPGGWPRPAPSRLRAPGTITFLHGRPRRRSPA